MGTLPEGEFSPQSKLKAERAKRIILWVMAIFIILPFILVWLTDSIRF